MWRGVAIGAVWASVAMAIAAVAFFTKSPDASVAVAFAGMVCATATTLIVAFTS